MQLRLSLGERGMLLLREALQKSAKAPKKKEVRYACFDTWPL